MIIKMERSDGMPDKMIERRIIYFAGGCFWGMEKYMASLFGVLETQAGYANGKTENPTYEDVCRHDTGHAETVRVVYDAAVQPLGSLLDLFFEAIDPFSVNRQGGDTGIQYRTGIYYTDPSDEPLIRNSLQKLENKAGKPPAIECRRLENFFKAEEYHQKYLDKNPGGYCHISPEKIAMAAKQSKERSSRS